MTEVKKKRTRSNLKLVAKSKTADKATVKPPAKAKPTVESMNDILPKVSCRHDKMISTHSLTTHPDNYNKHPQEQLVRIGNAIASNGWRQPIVVSKLSGHIVKGEGRYRAAVLRGWPKVPVEYQNYESESDELSDLVADNKAGEGSESDLLKLSETFAKIKMGGKDPSLAMALTDSDKSLMAKAQRDDERMRGQMSEDDTGKVATERAIPEMELRPFEHHDYIMITTDDMRDFVWLCTVLGIRREQYFTNPKATGSSSRVGVSRVVSSKRVIESLGNLGIVDKAADGGEKDND